MVSREPHLDAAMLQGGRSVARGSRGVKDDSDTPGAGSQSASEHA
jgi:hypothetical protein